MNIDFTGVKSITIPEGSVKKITRKSDGAVLWEKVEYKWQKYNVNSVTTYSLAFETTTTGGLAFEPGKTYTMGSSYTFDSTTGAAALSGTSSVRGSALPNYFEYYPYYMYDGELYKLVSYTTQNNYGMHIFAQEVGVVTSTTETSQGSYIEDVTSSDEAAYPENGIHTDGYWYVKVAA